jgi:hypothetical protein
MMNSASEKRVTLDGFDLVFKKTDDQKTFIHAIRSLKKFEMEHNRRGSDQNSGNSFEGSDGVDMGRHATKIDLEGEIVGDGAYEAISELRKRYLKGQPLELVSKLSLESGINKVMIEELNIASVKGSPYNFHYVLKLVEYVEP